MATYLANVEHCSINQNYESTNNISSAADGNDGLSEERALNFA